MATIKLVFGDDIRRVVLEDVTVPGLVTVITTVFGELRSSPFRVAWRDEDGDNIFIACQGDLDEAVRFAKQENLPAIRLFVLPVNASTPASNPAAPVPTPAPAAPTATTAAPAAAPASTPSTRTLSASSVSPSPVVTPTPAPVAAPAPAVKPAPAAPSPAAPAEAQADPRPAQPQSFPHRGPHRPTHHSVRPPYAGPVHHVGVTCDGCNLPLYGIRYKCTDCYDFDLCERCEASNVHPEDHILLKIRVPLRQRLIPTWEDNMRRPACPYGSPFGRRGPRRFHVPEDETAEAIERQFQQHRVHRRRGEQQQTTTSAAPAAVPAVVPPVAEPVAVPAPAPAVAPVEQQQPQEPVQQPQEYAEELEMLHNMGFYNDERNLYYLRRTLGRLDAVIDALTQMRF